MAELDVTIVIPPTGNTIVVDPNAAAAAAASAALAASEAALATSEAANAAGSASTAAADAAVATNQAAAAATSAQNAATSATGAAASASTSTTNANNVTALLASFRGVFLGAFDSDSDATAFATANSITLAAGVMYENKTEDKFRIYSGSAWGDYDASAQASQSAAALSASNAAASASAASTSATNAANSASAASTSETNAANSATASAGSASSSATSATNAANSATAAASSAASMNGELALTVASGVNNLTAAQAANAVYKLTGALTSNATIVIPSAGTTPHNFSVQNNTTGPYGVTISVQGQTPSVTVVQGLSTALFSDATGVYSLSAPVGMQFSKQTVLSGAGTTTLDTSYLGSIVYFTAASQIVKLPLASSYAAGEGVATKNIATGLTGQVQVQGSDGGDAAFPYTQNYGDTVFWVSDSVSKWYVGWYSNEMTPSFSTSVSSPKFLAGQSDNGVDAVQAGGSVSATGAGGVLRMIGAAAAAAAQFVSTALGLDLLANGNNPLRIFTNALERLRVTGAGRVLINTTTDDGSSQVQVNGGIALHTGAANATITLDSNAAVYREVVYETAGALRWAQGVDNSAEGGSNAGSNWLLSRYTDAGTLVDSPLSVLRSTGVATFSQRPVFGANTPWDSGNFTPASYLPLSGGTLTGAVTTAAAGLVFSDGSQQASAALRKNRIINGACDVAQRVSLVLSTGIGGYGGPDRFFSTNGSGGGQFTQSQGTITFNGVTRNAVVQTVNTAISSMSSGNYWSGIQQRVEGRNCYDLVNVAIAVSFIFNTNVTGTFSFSLVDGGSANSYVTTFSATANTPEKVKILIPASAGLNISNSNGLGLFVTAGFLNTGTYQTSTLNAWQSGAYYSASGATNWGAAANNFIALTELQLIAGSVDAPFERRSYGQEFMLSQRYYQQNHSNPASTVGNCMFSGNVTNGSVYYGTVRFPVVMRSSPTVVLSQNGAVNFTSANAAYNTGPDNYGFTLDNLANGTGSGYFFYGWSASAEL